ncbi:MAG: hypothetical protein R3A13_09120 [Bdellovibrionota bacterium]
MSPQIASSSPIIERINFRERLKAFQELLALMDRDSDLLNSGREKSELGKQLERSREQADRNALRAIFERSPFVESSLRIGIEFLEPAQRRAALKTRFFGLELRKDPELSSQFAAFVESLIDLKSGKLPKNIETTAAVGVLSAFYQTGREFAQFSRAKIEELGAKLIKDDFLRTQISSDKRWGEFSLEEKQLFLRRFLDSASEVFHMPRIDYVIAPTKQSRDIQFDPKTNRILIDSDSNFHDSYQHPFTHWVHRLGREVRSVWQQQLATAYEEYLKTGELPAVFENKPDFLLNFGRAISVIKAAWGSTEGNFLLEKVLASSSSFIEHDLELTAQTLFSVVDQDLGLGGSLPDIDRDYGRVFKK